MPYGSSPHPFPPSYLVQDVNISRLLNRTVWLGASYRWLPVAAVSDRRTKPEPKREFDSQSLQLQISEIFTALGLTASRYNRTCSTLFAGIQPRRLLGKAAYIQ